MYCLRCGRTTADDEEFCRTCAEEVVEDRVVADEPVEVTRCRQCHKQVHATARICPNCGADQVRVTNQ
jgi:RNA polymerase subunit RPABC4/transcription elongation factor Spt4